MLQLSEELQMYIYKISEGEYEYQCDKLLNHDNCYTKDEFKKIIIGAINYNKKHIADCINDINDIEETLINLYGFNKYELTIQASEYDDWHLANIVTQ